MKILDNQNPELEFELIGVCGICGELEFRCPRCSRRTHLTLTNRCGECGYKEGDPIKRRKGVTAQ